MAATAIAARALAANPSAISGCIALRLAVMVFSESASRCESLLAYSARAAARPAAMPSARAASISASEKVGSCGGASIVGASGGSNDVSNRNFWGRARGRSDQ
jgi:hypothetical protein